MESSSLPRGPLLWTIIAGFFLLTFTIYYQSLWNPFVRWDDTILIYENPAIHAITPETLKVIFTSYDPELYIPLTFFSYQLNYMMAGTNPIIYHLTNLVLHTLNALLVCWFLMLVGMRRSIALLCGLLFAVHPLHTEAISWASARKDVLSTCFFLLSLNWFLCSKKLQQKKYYVLSVGAFLLALLSKVTAAMLPGILILFAWIHREKFSKKVVMQLLPFISLSIIFIIVAVIGKEAVLADTTYMQMTLMATKSTVFYLQKLIVPTDLSVLYPYTEEITLTNFLVPAVMTSILLVLMVHLLLKRKLMGLGLGFFFLLLLPTYSNFIRGDNVYFASDRYAYIPSIGIMLILALLLEKLVRDQKTQQAVIGCSIFVIGIFSWMAHAQAAVWNGSEALFSHAIALYPNSHVGHNNLGNVYYRRDDTEKAIESYNNALSLHDHHRTRSNLAAAFRKQGRFAESLQEYERVLAKNSNSKDAHFGLGLLAAQQGNFDQAVTSYTRALEIDPSYAEVNINFGALYMQLGDTEKALEQYDRALYILPFSASAHYNRAIALRKLKKTKEAIAAYEQAIALEPTFVAARINLGILYHERRKIDDAIAQFEAVLRYDPGNKRAASALQQLR